MPTITVQKLLLIVVIIGLGAFAAARIQVSAFYARSPLIMGVPTSVAVGQMRHMPKSNMLQGGAKRHAIGRTPYSNWGAARGFYADRDDPLEY